MAVIAPSDLVVTVISSSRIDITWKNNGNYDWIQVYRGKGNTEELAIAALDSYTRRRGSSEYMEDKGWEAGVEVGLEADEWYAYKIFGYTVHPYVASDFSNIDAGETLAALSAPTLVVATPISDIEIDLTFKDKSSEEKWHRVQRKLGAGAYANVVDLEPNREFFRDGGLFLLAAGYTDCVPTDIGKQVQDDTVEIGLLVAYDNTRRRWLIDSGNTIANASAMTITGGTGAGTAARATTGLVKDSLYTYKVHAMQEEGDLGTYALESAQVTTLDKPAIPTLAAILDADTQDKSIRIRWPGVVEGLWKTATLYHVNDWVTNDSISYICILQHTSEAAKEPGIGINWITNWEVVTGYKIEQDKDAEGYVEIAKIGAGINNFLVTGLTPGVSYDFRVRAYNAAGNSGYSATRAKTTDAAYVRTEFEKWIRDPNIEPVYLAEVNPKKPFEGFPFMKDDDLVGCWPFDEGSGMVAYDKSKYGNHGTLENMTEADWVDGVVGKCLDFDGEDDHVRCADDTSFNIKQAITLSARIYIHSTASGKGTIISKSYQNQAYTFIYLNGSLRARLISGASSYYTIKSGALSLNEWHHVVFIWDKTQNDGKGRIFVDDEEVSYSQQDALTSDIDTYAGCLYIGGDRASVGSYAFDGLIDEPRIYNRALTEGEVKALYNSPRNGFRLVAGKTYTYEHAFTDRVIVEFEKVYEDGEEYAEKSSINEVEAIASTFYFDTSTKILYVHTSTGADPIGFYTEGRFWLYISNQKNIEFNDNFYLPLLSKEDIPDITQEIKPYFEGSFGIASGSIAFANAKIGGEHFFDKKFAAYTWINAKIILKAGKDTFIYDDFKEIFTAYVNEKSCSDTKIVFQLRDMRSEMSQSISLNKFNTTDYPDIDETFIGKLIPAIFGFRDLTIPIPIDMENQHFKFNDSSIGTRSGSIERVEKNGAELTEDTHYYVNLQRSIITFERDGRFIITAANKKIDFKEGAGGELTATLTENTYTTAGLCAEIQAKMRAAGSFLYVVGPTDIPATPPKKFTIAAGADEVFSLLWKTGTNGADGTDTNIGTTIGFSDDEDGEGEESYEAEEDVITIQKGDIIKVSCKGFVNSADETIDNGAEIFKYLMNNYKGIQDSELNLDSIYATKSAKPNVLALPIESEPSFDELVRTIEHSMEAYTFQDEFGRLGIKPQQTVAASNVKYVISKQIFDHAQKKDRSTLFWKVNVYYNKDYDDNWEVKTATKNEIKWQYRVTKILPIDTYFTSSSHAADLAASILSLLNKEQIENELPMLLFDVMAGDLVIFSRTRFYNLAGTANEITLRINKISKSPGSGKTSIIAEVK